MKNIKLVILFQVLMILLPVATSFSTETECRLLKKEVQKLANENEKIQEEIGRQSLAIDMAARNVVNKRMAKLARTAEDLTPKIDKANCKQYAWFALSEIKTETGTNNQKLQTTVANWCLLITYESGSEPVGCTCDLVGADILKEKTEFENGQNHTTVKNTLTEKNGPDGKVIQMTIYLGDMSFPFTKEYFRYEKDCKATEAPIIAAIQTKQKRLEDEKKAKLKAYE